MYWRLLFSINQQFFKHKNAPRILCLLSLLFSIPCHLLFRQCILIFVALSPYNCAPLVADLFLFCYEREFMLSLSDNNQTDIIEAFNSTSRYLDDLLNIDNPYFEQMVCTELQLNKANSSDTKTSFLDLNLSIANGMVSSKIYDKRYDFYFEIVNFTIS